MKMNWDDARLPVFIGANGQAAAWYEDGAERVGVYVATYASQGPDDDVASATNQPAGKGGLVVARRTLTVPVGGGSLPFKELEVVDLGAENHRLVWVGLRVRGRVTASGVVAKVLQVLGVAGGRRDAQVVVLTALCDADCGAARSRLTRFAGAGAHSIYLQAERSLHEQQE